MTDGNMGNQVAPASMEDAKMMSTMFARISQAIVDASEYPAKIGDLQAQIDKLQFELNAKSTHAEQLDRSLSELRQERDGWRTEAHSLQTDLDRSKISLADNERTISSLTDKLHSTEQSLDEAKAERDKYGLQMLNLEEQVKEWKGKAEAARAKLADLATMFQPEPEPAKPEPVSEPIDVPAFLAGPDNEVVKASDIPSAPEPAMQSPEPQPVIDSRPEWVDEWEPGYAWSYDEATGRHRYHRS